MRCPNCGSLMIVWDYERGDIICSSCGLVIDRIVTSYTPHKDQDVTISNDGRSHDKVRLKSVTETYLKLLEKAKKLSGDVKIDVSAFNKFVKERNKQVKVFYREFNTDKLKDRSISRILDVMKKYPRLKSRTDRAKLAIALITLYIISRASFNIPYSDIQRDTGLSRVHIKRLISVVRREENFLREVREVLAKN